MTHYCNNIHHETPKRKSTMTTKKERGWALRLITASTLPRRRGDVSQGHTPYAANSAVAPPSPATLGKSQIDADQASLRGAS